MDAVTLLGTVAGIASTSSFVPQVVKVVRTRDTASISAAMYAVTVTAFALWVTYGVLIGAWPVIVSNAVSLMLSGFILVMKLLPRRGKEEIADKLEPVVGREGG